jgi:hypothetical protein
MIHPPTAKEKNLKKMEKRNPFLRFAFPVTGLASLLWLAVRVLPKPSRANYPCMKVAAPLATGFLAYLGAVFAGAVFFRKAVRCLRQSRFIVASAFLLCAFGFGLFSILRTDVQSLADFNAAHEYFIPTDPANAPVGMPRGIYPGRVVWMWDSTAANWNGKSGNWWEDRYTNQDRVDSMLSEALRALTGRSADAEAWDALFKYFNERHGKGSIGYRPGEKIAVKYNLVDCAGAETAGNTSFPAPQVVLALLRQIVRNAGASASDVTFFDTGKYVPKPVREKCKAEFPDVRFMGWSKSTGQEKYARDTSWTMRWSQPLTLEIGGGHAATLPTTVTEAAYLINLASFKAHRYVGVTAGAKNHFGTFSCDGDDGKPRMEGPHMAGVHAYVTVHDFIVPGSVEWSFKGREMGTYNALVDLMGHRLLGENTLLFMVDGLYATQTEHDAVSLKSRWLSSPFHNDWTSSIFLSQDGVAIESVDVDFFRTEAAVNPNIECVYGTVDNYLHEAAQADNPPSGVFYDPEGDGTRLPSLGVHEHWNDAEKKQYSRNLGLSGGIELVQAHNPSAVEPDVETRPAGFTLLQNYPNPFNSATTIRYDLAGPSRVRLEVRDLRGRCIRTLVEEEQQAGVKTEVWDGRDAAGYPAGSGVYLARMEVNAGVRSFIYNKRMILIQ